MQRTADARRLTADEADAWIRTLNDARLVLGTRLEVTEETTEEDLRDDPARVAAFRHYQLLSAVVDGLVEVMGNG